MGTPNNTLLSPSNEFERAKLEKFTVELSEWLQSNRNLLEVLLDAYCVVDRSNRVVDFNVAFTELCGQSYRKIKKIGLLSELIHAGTCPTVTAMAEGRSIRLDEIQGSSKAFPELQMIIGAVPLYSSDRKDVIGSLVTLRNVSAENLLQRKYDERKKESIIDGLTRVYNKKYAEEYLVLMLKNALRDSQALSVVMCDLDHFKKINDTHGHQAGDYVLKLVSGMIRKETRDTDAVGRFGGEEFLVMLAKSDREGAHIFSERLRKRIESTNIVFEGTSIPVTMSLGTATFKEEWKPGLDPEVCGSELVARADSALYFAKANGRNKTCQVESLPNQSTGTKADPEDG